MRLIWFPLVLLLTHLISPGTAPSLPIDGVPLPLPSKSVMQDPAQSAQPIRVSSNLVQVPVSVTDAQGRPVKTLQKEDFFIEENGIQVVIAHMGEPGETRLDMDLVFDVTGSVFARFDFEREAATSFLNTVFRQGDSVAILAIGSKPQVMSPRTRSLAAALESLGLLRPSGASTAFFDSVIAAAQMLRGPADPETRRVQIVLSDGEDNLSERQLTDAIRSVQEADCIFYSINPGGSSIRLNKVSLRGQQGMESLADETGGFAFLAESVEDLPRIFGRIAAELQAQYLLSYYSPEAKSDGFRRIAVRVPKHPELRVRARLGYYSGNPASRLQESFRIQGLHGMPPDRFQSPNAFRPLDKPQRSGNQ